MTTKCARVLVVTGASGVGKTTLVRLVEARGMAGVTFHYFDSVGVEAADALQAHISALAAV